MVEQETEELLKDYMKMRELEAFKDAIWSYIVHENMIDVYRDLNEAGYSERIQKMVEENNERIRDAAVALYAERDKQAKLIVEGLQ